MDDTLTCIENDARTREAPAARLFPVRPGRVYELCAVLRRRDSGNAGLSVSALRLDFLGEAGQRVDPNIVGPDLLVPHLDPVQVETLPAVAEGETAFDAGMAFRFLAAPPDSAELCVVPPTQGVEVLYLELSPIAVSWPTMGKRFAKECRRLLAARMALLERLVPPTGEAGDSAAREAAATAPLQQLAALSAQFAPAGDWGKALQTCDAATETADLEVRLARMRADRTEHLRIGFIGSSRSYNRLRAHADVFLLREDAWEAQLVSLALDQILIETVPESWAGDWQLAFCSLDGNLPEKGRALCAKARPIPIRLLVSVEESEIGVWRDLIKAADAVVIEGERSDWTVPPDGAVFIRRGIEPAVTPPVRNGARTATMLVPVASDIFQFPDFAALLNEPSCYDLLVTEVDYEYFERALRQRVPKMRGHSVNLRSFGQRTRLLQESSIVLLNGNSVRSPSQMANIVIDTIACGAIPIVYRPRQPLQGLDLSVDCVYGPAEFFELQRLLLIPWYRERRWRELYREVCRNHVWCADDRRRLVGIDPCPAAFDAPLLTAILVSKRPERLDGALRAFRRQSWPHKELVVVLHLDAAPETLPRLNKNERIFVAPSHWNLGRCLNMGISEARGRFWHKIDDDDFYSQFYLEESAWLYRSTQADAVGRASAYFYFEEADATFCRPDFTDIAFRMLQKGGRHHLAGPALSARRHHDLPSFSSRVRSGSDALWVRDLQRRSARIVRYDTTSLVMFRAADQSVHTWYLLPSGTADLPKNFVKLCRGNMHDALP